jgi:hypothetical protein
VLEETILDQAAGKKGARRWNRSQNVGTGGIGYQEK